MIVENPFCRYFIETINIFQVFNSHAVFVLNFVCIVILLSPTALSSPAATTGMLQYLVSVAFKDEVNRRRKTCIHELTERGYRIRPKLSPLQEMKPQPMQSPVKRKTKASNKPCVQSLDSP